MKYVVNPPYTFYGSTVSVKKLQGKNLVATAPYKTHSRDVETFLYSDSKKLELDGKYEIYVLSLEEEKMGPFRTLKRYVHSHKEFTSLFDAALEYFNATGKQLAPEQLEALNDAHKEDIEKLSEKEQAAFSLTSV